VHAAAQVEETVERATSSLELSLIARQALELGILQRQSFPFQTPDAFRRIRDAEKRNAFRAWIRSVRFPERRR